MRVPVIRFIGDFVPYESKRFAHSFIIGDGGGTWKT